MWLLFGAGSKKRAVKGGVRVERWCDKCGATRTFIECEIEDKVEVFFVPIVDGKSRRLACEECGEDVELTGAATTPPPARPQRTPAPPTPARRMLSEKEKDKLLAELKKKMSR